MIESEVKTIIKNNLDILEAVLNMMTIADVDKVEFNCNKQRVLELRAICMLAYYHLTGEDLQTEPFNKKGE